MAPFIGPDRDALLRLLAAPNPTLPITLGHMTPQATVTHEGGVWRIVALAMDHEAAGQAGRAALASGNNWMPEHEWRFLGPDRVLVEAATKDAFVAAIRKMKWTFSD
jgi:hypothetical protein